MVFSTRRIIPLIMTSFMALSCFFAQSAEQGPARGLTATKIAVNLGAAGALAGICYFLKLRNYDEYYGIKALRKRLPDCETRALFNHWNATAFNNQVEYNNLCECERDARKLLPWGITYWWENKFFEKDRFAALICPECASRATWQHFVIVLTDGRSVGCNCRKTYANNVAQAMVANPYAYWQPNLDKIMDTLWLIDQFKKIVDPLKQMHYDPLFDYNHANDA